MGLSDGQCDICGNEFTEYIQDEQGLCYCSESCYESTLPTCTICKQPMRSWTETTDGKRYCSNECYETTLARCKICNKSLREWIESEGEKFCSEECFLLSCPTCSVCGNHVDRWQEDDQGYVYCSDQCREITLPTCAVCETVMDEWLVSQDNRKFCSEECYSHTLPRCMHCDRPMKEWLVTTDGRVYCSESCHSESDVVINKLNIVCDMTGLTVEDLGELMQKNSWNLDEAISNLEDYMKSLDGAVVASTAAVDGLKNANILGKLSENLSSYNTMRGGPEGFKGFVFEELHAANASLKGSATEVIANNGLADFLIANSDGSYSLGQAKLGYNSTNIDWSAYQGQTIVIDKGNTKLIESAKKAGMKVIESDVSKPQAQKLAKAMQLESKITGKPNAPITSHVYSYNQAGVSAAKKGAAFGAGFSIGTNLVDLATGDKELGEAAVAVAKDTIVATGASYVIGAGSAALANTAVGGAVVSAATAAGATLAGTSVGTAAIAAGTAITTASSGVAAAAAGTAVGSAIVSGATAAATIIGSTAAGAAIVAAAPLVAAGAAIGGAVAIAKKVFRK